MEADDFGRKRGDQRSFLGIFVRMTGLKCGQRSQCLEPGTLVGFEQVLGQLPTGLRRAGTKDAVRVPSRVASRSQGAEKTLHKAVSSLNRDAYPCRQDAQAEHAQRREAQMKHR